MVDGRALNYNQVKELILSKADIDDNDDGNLNIGERDILWIRRLINDVAQTISKEGYFLRIRLIGKNSHALVLKNKYIKKEKIILMLAPSNTRRAK